MEYEFELCQAQAYEALDELCHNLRYRAYEWNYKKWHVIGQSAQTCAHNLISRVEERISQSANKYNKAHLAMAILCTHLKLPINWQSELRLLAKEHIWHLSEKDEDETEGTKEISWIWFVGSASVDDDEDVLQDGMYDFIIYLWYTL